MLLGATHVKLSPIVACIRVAQFCFQLKKNSDKVVGGGEDGCV